MKNKETELLCRRIYAEKLPMFTYSFEIVDKKTGVCYLFIDKGSDGAAITPRLNSDGTPMIADSHVIGG